MTHTLLTTNEVAEYLDSNINTLARWRKNGTLPAFKMKTGGIRYEAKAVKEFKNLRKYLSTRSKTKDFSKLMG